MPSSLIFVSSTIGSPSASSVDIVGPVPSSFSTFPAGTFIGKYDNGFWTPGEGESTDTSGPVTSTVFVYIDSVSSTVTLAPVDATSSEPAATSPSVIISPSGSPSSFNSPTTLPSSTPAVGISNSKLNSSSTSRSTSPSPTATPISPSASGLTSSFPSTLTPSNSNSTLGAIPSSFPNFQSNPPVLNTVSIVLISIISVLGALLLLALMIFLLYRGRKRRRKRENSRENLFQPRGGKERAADQMSDDDFAPGAVWGRGMSSFTIARSNQEDGIESMYNNASVHSRPQSLVGPFNESERSRTTDQPSTNTNPQFRSLILVPTLPPPTHQPSPTTTPTRKRNSWRDSLEILINSMGGEQAEPRQPSPTVSLEAPAPIEDPQMSALNFLGRSPTQRRSSGNTFPTMTRPAITRLAASATGGTERGFTDGTGGDEVDPFGSGGDLSGVSRGEEFLVAPSPSRHGAGSEGTASPAISRNSPRPNSVEIRSVDDEPDDVGDHSEIQPIATALHSTRMPPSPSIPIFVTSEQGSAASSPPVSPPSSPRRRSVFSRIFSAQPSRISTSDISPPSSLLPLYNPPGSSFSAPTPTSRPPPSSASPTFLSPPPPSSSRPSFDRGLSQTSSGYPRSERRPNSWASGAFEVALKEEEEEEEEEEENAASEVGERKLEQGTDEFGVRILERRANSFRSEGAETSPVGSSGTRSTRGRGKRVSVGSYDTFGNGRSPGGGGAAGGGSAGGKAKSSLGLGLGLELGMP